MARVVADNPEAGRAAPVVALAASAVVAGLLVVMAVVRARLAVAHNRSTPTTKASPLWSTRWETRQPRLAVAV